MRLTINRRTELALRAVRLLEGEDSLLQASVMASRLDSSAQFLPQALRPLVRAGWLHSEPGPTGGYRLAAPLDGRSLLELIEILEGPIDNGACALKGGPCGVAECSLHVPWQEARRALLAELAKVSISQMDTKGAGS